MKPKLEDIMLILALMFAIGVLVYVLFGLRYPPQVPKCPEDAVYVGGGQYRDNHWDYLYCRNLD